MKQQSLKRFNVKSLFLSLVTLSIILFTGCNDEKEMPDVEKYHIYLGKYGIKIGDIDEGYSYVEGDNEAWLMGGKDNKYWLRLYHTSTLKLIKQWNLPQGAEYDAIQWPAESPIGYLFYARRRHADPVSKNGYIIAADHDKDVVDLVYTLTDKDWLAKDRGPDNLNDIPHLKSYDNFIYIHNEGKGSPVFRDLFISRQGLTVSDASRCIIGDTILFTGFNHDKIWVGLFNEKTAKKINEWTINESFNRTIPLYGGNDTYFIRSILPDNVNLIHTAKGMAVALRYSDEIGSKDPSLSFWQILGGDVLFLNKDDNNAHLGKAGILSLANITDTNHFFLKKWEADKVMFKVRKNASSDYLTLLFSADGTFLEDISTINGE